MSATNVIISPPAGATVFTESDLNTTVDTVKGSAGTIYVIEVDNTANAAITYLKLFHLATAVTLGTTAPNGVFLVPASTNQVFCPVPGLAFANGLQAACVTAGGTAGTTAPTSAVIVRIVYA